MRSSLRPHKQLADALGKMFSPQVEVVIHDLMSEKVVYVSCPFSKREIGDPSLLGDIDYSPDSDIIGPYEKINWDGRRIRSTSIVLKDEKNNPQGLMCVNFDVTMFSQTADMLKTFIGASTSVEQPESLFQNDWHEKINEFVSAWTAEKNTTIQRLDREQKKDLVVALHGNGAFQGPNVATYVARVLGLGRATVYKYINIGKQK